MNMMNAEVKVYNAVGELVLTKVINGIQNQMELQGNFPEGVYVVTVQSENFYQNFRWIVKK